jgi:GH24 family phage-related lysozyme (muramidase)
VSNASPISLEQLFRYYKALPHQAAAVAELQNDLRANGYDAAMRRDRPWFSTWSQDGKQADLAPALKLIKEFEGCHLEAYPDPLHGWDVATIGYGTTRYRDGRKVQKGDKINAIEADMLLRQEVDQIAAKLGATVPFWKEMGDCQKSALISFAYNLGSGFYGTSGFKTIRAALAEKRWKDVPAAMLLYRNPNTPVEAGLKRRRTAEGKLWLEDMPEMPDIDVPRFTPGSPFSLRVTPNITYGEFALNQEARRFDHQHQCDTAIVLAQFLERARTHFGGKPVIITSGYRPPAVNRSVGGASASEHLYAAPGEGAVDAYIDGVSVQAFQNWCDKEWPYSIGYGAPKGFVHIGIRKGKPRVRWDY